MKFKLTIFIISALLTAQAIAEDFKKCSNINKAAYPEEYRFCIRTRLAIDASEAGIDCIDCFAAEEKQPAEWVQALGVLAQPLTVLAGAYLTSKYAYKSQEAWANSYAAGTKECTNRFNNYLTYSTEVGANPITSSEAQSLMNVCNGSGYGTYSGFAGYSGNGYGGFSNPYQANGYSSGFMTGMVGPYYGGGVSTMNGQGMGTGIYGSLNVGLYGGSGAGVYGNYGQNLDPNILNYNGANPQYYGGGMNYGGMGINPMYSAIGSNASGAYGIANLSGNIGLSATAGFSF